MHRRRLLGAIGATGVSLTAGCAGLGLRVRNREPAAFETSLSGPSELALGEAFAVTVTVTNTGGQRGLNRGTLWAFDGMIHRAKLEVEVGTTDTLRDSPGRNRRRRRAGDPLSK